MIGAITEFEQKYVRPAQGRTLIAGSRVYGAREDRRKRYVEAEGWDAVAGDGVDYVVDLEERAALSIRDVQFAHIECVSVLEHSRRPWLVAQNLELLLLTEGTLFLTVPFVWRVHAYPSDYWRFTLEGVRLLFPQIEWSAICYAHTKLTEETKAQAVDVKGYPYLARTEVCGFGRRI